MPGLRHMRCSAAARRFENTSAGHVPTRQVVDLCCAAPAEQRLPPSSVNMRLFAPVLGCEGSPPARPLHVMARGYSTEPGGVLEW